MNRPEPDDGILQRAKDAIDGAFPDLRCLRCGRETFELRIVQFSDILNPNGRIELTCTHCGKIEHFDARCVQRLADEKNRVQDG